MKQSGKSQNPVNQKKIKSIKDINVLVVTETPPGTLNGFGSMQQNFYQGFSPKLIFTNADFKKEGESQGFVLGQVPYHRAGKYIGDFVKGRIPEWRSFFSAKWLKKKIY